MQATAFFLTEAYSTPTKFPFSPEAPALLEEDGDLYVSRMEGRNCAKGFLWAMGLEVGAVFCLYGIWQMAHILL